MAGRRGRRRKKGHEEAHADERWLLTYADLITLLMALFMVLWSISSVNISKFESLQRSLSQAFSGGVVTGGQGIKQNGGSNRVPTPADQMPVVALEQMGAGRVGSAADRKQRTSQEKKRLEEVQRKVERLALERGVSGKLKASMASDGLHIRITTDDLLFDSGSAQLKPSAGPVLTGLGEVLAAEGQHAVVVSGHTDNVPISGRYASNWNLSSDRASNVVVALQRAGVSGNRLTARGRADEDPVTTNKTELGRSMNRRVELLLPREYPGTGGSLKPNLVPRNR